MSVPFTPRTTEVVALKEQVAILVAQNTQILGQLLEMQKPKPKRASKPKDGSSKSPSKLPKPSVVIPFCNLVYPGRCEGVVVNHNLFTQCMRLPGDEGDGLCSICLKSADGDGEPTHGRIQARLNNPCWQSNGRCPISYGNVMEKLEIARGGAEAAVREFGAHFPDMDGLTIPEDQFAVVKKPRGRPKKPTDAADTSSESSPAKPKAARGRKPKAPKGVVEASPDLMASLIAQAEDSDSDIAETEIAEPAPEPEPEPELTPPPPPPLTCLACDEDAEAEKKAAKKSKKTAAKTKKRAAEKAEKEAAKAAEKAAEKAAKEALKAAAKAEKEAAKAEKEAAKAAEKAKKEKQTEDLKLKLDGISKQMDEVELDVEAADESDSDDDSDLGSCDFDMGANAHHID